MARAPSIAIISGDVEELRARIACAYIVYFIICNVESSIVDYEDG